MGFLEGKTAIITGAGFAALKDGSASSIGYGIATAYAKEGANLVITGRNVKKLETAKEKLEAEYGIQVLCVAADVNAGADNQAVVQNVIDQAIEKFGRIDVLVNNAGIAGQIQFQDITDAQWNRYLGVNLGGARNTIQAVLPHMLHEKAGCIVNISSIWGLRGASCEVAYACTKAALVGLTRSLALELAPSHIRVNCVAPGVINTDMVQVLGQETLRDLAEQTPLGRLGTPEDVAHAVAFLASDKASFLTGQILAADGGFIV